MNSKNNTNLNTGSVIDQKHIINKATVALELGETDTPMLRYFSYLSNFIQINQANIIHVVPNFDLHQALFKRDLRNIESQITLNTELLDLMKNKLVISELEQTGVRVNFKLLSGNPLQQLIEENNQTEGNLMVIGQKSNTSNHIILAKNLARHAKTDILIIPQKTSNKFNKILVPIDFSLTSVKALKTALAIATQAEKSNHQIKVVCLYVYRIPNLTSFQFQQPWIQLKTTVKENIEDSFDTFLQNNAAEQLHLLESETIYADQKNIGKVINDYAETCEADLLLMGAKGHSKVHLFMLGSVAEKVIELNQELPIMLVR